MEHDKTCPECAALQQKLESQQHMLNTAYAFHDLAVKERDALRVSQFSVKSDAEKLAADLEATKKAYFELEKVLLREGGVEGAYERRLAEAVRERDEALARCETLRGLADTAAAEQGLAQRKMMEAQRERGEAKAYAKERNDEANKLQRLLNMAAQERDEARAELAKFKAMDFKALDDCMKQRDEARAELARLRDAGGDGHNSSAETALKGEVARLRVVCAALRKQRDEARDSDTESLRLYRNARERLDKVQEERDFATAALRAMKSPAECCAESRREGKGGCGACALCCKELREQVEALAIRIPKVARKQQEKDVEAMTDALNDLRRILPYDNVGVYKVVMAIRQRVLDVQYVTDTGEA